MNVVAALAFLLAADSLDAASLETKAPAADTASSVRSSPAAVHPDSILDRLSALGLRRVRVTVREGRYVFVRPLFTERGVGWGAVEGFPRRRPAVIAGANWDSVKPPPNPVAWADVRQLESPHVGRRTGAITGGAVAFVLIGLPSIGLAFAVDSMVPDADVGSLYPVIGAIALAATLVGAAIGHAVIPPETVWEPMAVP